VKVHRYVLTNVPIGREKEVIAILMQLVKKSIIGTADIHRMEEEKRES
jgi:hypothetical protein